MEIRRHNGTLTICGVRELTAAKARSLRHEICTRLDPDLDTIEIDLSQSSLVDSCGLAVLVSVFKAANEMNGGVVVRLLNLQPPVQQMLELTRLHHLFEIGEGAPGLDRPARGLSRSASPAPSG